MGLTAQQLLKVILIAMSEKPNPQNLRAAQVAIRSRLRDGYATDAGVNSETLIGAMGALAGEAALRACGLALPEKGWVTGTRAPDILCEGPASFWAFVRMGALRAAALVNDLPFPKEVRARTQAGIGQTVFPVLTIPEAHYPREYSPLACARYRPNMQRVAADHSLDHQDLSAALGLAVGAEIYRARDTVKPGILATLALEVAMGVAHLAPVRAR